MEIFYYLILRTFGFLVRLLPVNAALALGRLMGMIVYYFDIRHKRIVSSNLKVAFAKSKGPNEIKQVTKQFFQNYGQNLIEFFRLPLMNREKFAQLIRVEGKEHVTAALQKKKGVILLAMHFGSWELASLSCAMMEQPYKVIVNPQKRYSKLDDLLNSYRSCNGNIVLSRGLGTREMIKSLQNNEIIGLVVDQGGRDGVLVPFFERQASMSVGAIRLGLKFDVPICFSIIIRDKGSYHRLVIHPALELENTGNVEPDIVANLKKIVVIMETYIKQYPAEYMWFYKIWKYSKESTVVILDDGRTGHLRQSQAVAATIEKALVDRGIQFTTATVKIVFRNKLLGRLMSFFSCLANAFILQGRMELLKFFLTEESFRGVISLKADFIISCGSALAGVNYFLSTDQQAKSVVILKPGLLSFNRFDLVILPQHDQPRKIAEDSPIIITKGAPNLITPEYLAQQSELLLKRFSHLKFTQRLKIGILLGGDTKEYILSEKQVKMIVNQLKEVAEQTNADLLITTSRRTSAVVENLLLREIKKHPRCQLLILPNRQDVPEAVGGILGVSDILIVSGDSISMISEAASSGKNTIIFSVTKRDKFLHRSFKHDRFIEQLNTQGYVISTDAQNVGRTIYDVAKNKMRTNRLDDRAMILDAARLLI